MSFSCSRCSFTSESEKGVKIHITKMHDGKASVKTGSRQVEHTEKQYRRPDTTKSNPRGSSYGSRHGKSEDHAEKQYQRSDTTKHNPRGASYESHEKKHHDDSRRRYEDSKPVKSAYSASRDGKGQKQDSTDLSKYTPRVASSSRDGKGRGHTPRHDFTEPSKYTPRGAASDSGDGKGHGQGHGHTQRKDYTELSTYKPKGACGGPRDMTYSDRSDRRRQETECRSSVREEYNDIILTGQSVSEVSKIVNGFIDQFHKQLEEISRLKFNRLNSGSYYDKTKNSAPDEFDYMFSPADVCVRPVYEGAPEGYCKMEIMSLPDELQFTVKTGEYLDPSRFKAYIFHIFERVLKDKSFRPGRKITKKERSGDSPAYTILYKGIPGKVLDIDLVPAIEICGWPDKARAVNPTWTIDNRLKAKSMERYHAVAKTCTDDVPHANMMWRLSFSWAEKKLIKHANAGDTKSCRKSVFRLLKGVLENIKERNPDRIKKFCSYHLKMFFLNQFDDPKYQSDSEDLASLFPYAIKQLLQALGDGGRRGYPKIMNYFMPSDNVIRAVPRQELALVCEGLREKYDSLLKHRK